LLRHGRKIPFDRRTIRIAKLLLVESPKKAKTIQSFLGRDWMVLATLGHIKDLPPKELGVETQKDFTPSYAWLKGKKALFSKIRSQAKSSESIFIGTDPDREGEFIAYQIHEELSSLKKPIYRTRFYQITESHIQEALQNPNHIEKSLVESQMARRIVDRLFGYLVSPKLWKELRIDQLSAGRVQSTVLQWICEKEVNIREFVSEPYVELLAIVKGNNNQDTKLLYIHEPGKLLQKKEAFDVLSAFSCQSPGVAVQNTFLEFVKETKKPHLQSNPKPFTTATFQETSSRLLFISPPEAIKIASSLYEGVALPGRGIQGLITYIRTDSTRVSPEKKAMGESYLRSLGYITFSVSKNQKTKANRFAQEAHEAILPIDPFLTPDSLRNHLTKQEFQIYQLIWNRFLQSLLPPERGWAIQREFKGLNHSFQHRALVITDSGFRAFGKEREIPIDPFQNWKLGDKAIVKHWEIEEKATEPPKRFTEGAIVQKMESTGIGRPSTYATTLQTLIKRKYIHLVKKSIIANPLGEKVNYYLSGHIPGLLGEQFTKQLEADLDTIVHQDNSWIELVRNFYFKLTKELNEKKDISPQQSKKKVEQCPLCREGFVHKKTDKKGLVILFCSRFPHCDYAEKQEKR